MRARTVIITVLAAVLGLAGGFLLAWHLRPLPGERAEEAQEETGARYGGVNRPGECAAQADDGSAAEGDFVEAVDASRLEDADEAESVTVEEVTDEDGLTPDARAEIFRRANPEEWERIRKNRTAAFEAMRARASEKQDFLDTIDEAHLTPNQRQSHGRFREALAVRTAARERIERADADGREPADDDLRALSEAERVLADQASVERMLLLEATARALGLQNEDVTSFLGIIRQIDACTNELR